MPTGAVTHMRYTSTCAGAEFSSGVPGTRGVQGYNAVMLRWNQS